MPQEGKASPNEEYTYASPNTLKDYERYQIINFFQKPLDKIIPQCYFMYKDISTLSK